MRRFFLCVSFLAALAGPALCANYVSQRNNQAALREGPGYDSRILWLYRHKGYPFQLIASYDAWRRVRDVDGIVGWMHVTMLSDQRTVLVIGKTRAQIRKSEDAGARVIGTAEPGAIAGVKSCTKNVCRIYQNGIDGWIEKSRLWGADPGEVFH